MKEKKVELFFFATRSNIALTSRLRGDETSGAATLVGPFFASYHYGRGEK